eukprot:626931-Pyramimonas_sp.AAC.1
MEHEFRSIVVHRKDSAAGPDGVPYSGWKNGGETVLSALYAAYRALLRGACPPSGFNFGQLVFPPKVE